MPQSALANKVFKTVIFICLYTMIRRMFSTEATADLKIISSPLIVTHLSTTSNQ